MRAPISNTTTKMVGITQRTRAEAPQRCAHTYHTHANKNKEAGTTEPPLPLNHVCSPCHELCIDLHLRRDGHQDMNGGYEGAINAKLKEVHIAL